MFMFRFLIEEINNLREKLTGVGGKSVDLGASGATDLNNLTKTGFYSGSQLVNGALTTGSAYVTHIEHRSNGYATQTFFSAALPKEFVRVRNNNVWGAWDELEFQSRLNQQGGYSQITPAAVNQNTTLRVYFAKPYSATPSISLTAFANTPNTVFCTLGSTTPAYFDIILYRPNIAATYVHWQSQLITQP